MKFRGDRKEKKKGNRKVNKKKKSLKKNLLALIIVIWFVPICLIYAFVSISYRNNFIKKSTTIMEESLKNFTYFISQRIDELIDISKRTSYDQVIEKAWRQYKNEEISKSELYKAINNNLKSRFYNDNRFVMSVFYLSEEPENIYYTSRKDSNYINVYKDKVVDEAHSITKQESSDAHIRIVDGKIYIIRNLYTTTNYTKFGTLILELNKDKLTDGISFNEDYELGFFINDTDSIISYDEDLFDLSRTGIVQELKSLYSPKENRTIIHKDKAPYTGVIFQQRYSDYHFAGILVANESVIFSELYDLYFIMFIIMLIIIPVFIYMICFIRHHISKPMDTMIYVVKELEGGAIGYVTDDENMPNMEFDVLLESFNHMSSEIKYLFDYAYNENIARKDAKIQALQSQINPHFLNNTLEMMNWQARMNEDITLSKMIEALGTLLDYSMDRSNRKIISLAEELRSVDAYLYIVSMRFGKRLKIEKDIDEKLLQVKVPQLILQPLIENSVVHGVEKIKKGVIKIKIYKDEINDLIVLRIINTGSKMTEDDIKKIEELLIPRSIHDPQRHVKHESLGIQNVNERIKLIYGNKYGLTVEQISKDEIASTITIPENINKKIVEDETRKIILSKFDS